MFGQQQQKELDVASVSNGFSGSDTTTSFGAIKPSGQTCKLGAPASATSQTSTELEATAPGTTGTETAKYQPSSGTDIRVKNGERNSVSTQYNCITAMKEYEKNSLEELRLEDYAANRIDPKDGGLFGTALQNKSSFGDLFGAHPATSTICFGASANIFDQTQQSASAFGQTQSTELTSTTGSAYEQQPGCKLNCEINKIFFDNYVECSFKNLI